MDNQDYLVIDNVAIPLRLNDRFIAPDLEDALKYYPEFIKHSKLSWSPQAYLSYIMKQIDLRAPNAYDGDQAVREFIYHVGLRRFVELLGHSMTSEEWEKLGR